MGGVVAANASGAEALFQNPALISHGGAESPSEVALGYDALIESAYQGSAAYARSLGEDGVVGAGVVYASQSPQTIYTSQGDSAGTFTPLDLAAGVGYSRRLGTFIVGGGIKAIRSSLNDRSGSSAAVDLGAVGRHVSDLGDGPLDVGISATNLGPPMKIGSIADPLPLRVRAGAVWHPNAQVDAAIDVVFPVDQDPYACLGVEARLPASKIGSLKPWSAALRVGYNQNRARNVDGFAGVSFGAGVDLVALRVDYAWVALGDLGSANRITLAFRF